MPAGQLLNPTVVRGLRMFALAYIEKGGLSAEYPLFMQIIRFVSSAIECRAFETGDFQISPARLALQLVQAYLSHNQCSKNRVQEKYILELHLHFSRVCTFDFRVCPKPAQ